MQNKPIIGIVSDVRVLDPHPFHIVGEKYILAIRDGSQAMPFLIPSTGEDPQPDEVLACIDGLFLTGSYSNVEPHHYAGNGSRAGTWHDAKRDGTTLPLARRALETGVPLLAVCRGFQELNVLLGGTLHQHVDEVAGLGNHKENPDDPLEVQYGPSHAVSLADGGVLRELAGGPTAMVNSLHGQAVDRLADGVVVEATSDDGLIEGFRVEDAAAYALAVQWHPEWKFADDPLSLAIFRSFGEACREYGRSNGRSCQQERMGGDA